MSWENKLGQLLSVVIENYISKWDPIGSKFLHSMDTLNFAPSTLRKYLNMLEKEWLVYQTYNNSGRIPTVEWLSQYVQDLIDKGDFQTWQEVIDIQVDSTRKSLRFVAETMGNVVDGVVVGFLRNDEYYYLGINNILKSGDDTDIDITRSIVKFIEDKEIIAFLDKKILRKEQIYYSFVDYDQTTISIVYAKIVMNGYDGMLAIIWPMRMDYRQNITVLQEVVKNLQ